ncbi:acylphosphatase [Phyllobacterium endophyticum]|uniref:Acylphosphatase n=1 Tax=Phyllobacterium endophyticum TaxID=1149773 RepID=A0A2P7AS01_9HYPH|nr:acylphosphatase [Phyllobacterium endophyticum]PSH56937.1 acylphosphatase [Phyllobacterium endophyticum]TYR39619.1 acylphosphatase [Phyllobacterium endophyticum]
MVAKPKSLIVTIRGKVQGVGFRYWTQTEAQKLGLRGWVRNESDGSVCALIVGPEHAVDKMLKRFEEGPGAASVSRVTSESSGKGQSADGFNIVGSD